MGHNVFAILEMEIQKIKTAIIYYSSTGTNYQLAQWASDGARQSGADIRIKKVSELALATAIDKNPLWKQHSEETKHVEMAALEDLEWADVIIFSALPDMETCPPRCSSSSIRPVHFRHKANSQIKL